MMRTDAIVGNETNVSAKTPLSPLATPTATRAVLDAHGLATKKSLGQNFLVNDAIIRKIIDLANLSPSDNVLEVGPGIGTLTIALLKNVAHVTSVERDPDLPPVLAETTKSWADKFTLLQKDALDLTTDDFANIALPTTFVANLPYAVAATVILGYFQTFPTLRSATVMVQKEVAERICAQPGSKLYGAYTVKLGLYARPQGMFTVGPNNFFPPPHVDSAVVHLVRETVVDEAGAPLNPNEIALTSEIANAAFANRRKTITNSFKAYFSGRVDADALLPKLLLALEQTGIDSKRRGETLTQADFIALLRNLKKI